MSFHLDKETINDITWTCFGPYIMKIKRKISEVIGLAIYIKNKRKIDNVTGLAIYNKVEENGLIVINIGSNTIFLVTLTKLIARITDSIPCHKHGDRTSSVSGYSSFSYIAGCCLRERSWRHSKLRRGYWIWTRPPSPSSRSWRLRSRGNAFLGFCLTVKDLNIGPSGQFLPWCGHHGSNDVLRVREWRPY